MNNFKRHKNSSHQRSSVDGLIGQPSRSSSNGSLSFGTKSNQVSYRASSIANFKRPSGFHSNGGSIEGGLRSGDRVPETRQREPADQVSSRTHNNHGHGRTRPLGLIRKSVATLFVIGLVSSGYLFGKGYLRALQVFRGGGSAAALQENVDPSRLRGEGDGRVNILMLGKGGPGHEAPDLTDTLLVASIDPVQKEAALLSLPRDFYVSDSTNYKINAIYADAKQRAVAEGKSRDNAEAAGLEAIETKLETILGIPIHYHAMIDFNGFKKAIDTVGGIDIDVKQPLNDLMHINGQPYPLDVKVGRQHFDGTKALMYARSRKTSLRGDFDRSERQRLVLIALREKVFTLGTFGNPLKINQLFDAFGGHIRTNLTVNELTRVYEIANGITSEKIASVGLADPPNSYVVTANLNGVSIVRPKAGLLNYSEIQNFVRNKLRDGFLQKEDATVAVLNGTNVSGLAARTAAELRSFGYSVSQVADSPIKNQQLTVIIDLRAGAKKYTKSYLEKRFGVKVISALPDARIKPGNADFVIILGQNEQTRLQN